MLCVRQRDARPAAHPITSLSQPRAQPCLPLAPLGAGQLLLLRRNVGVTWSLVLAPLGAGQLLLLRRNECDLEFNPGTTWCWTTLAT